MRHSRSQATIARQANPAPSMPTQLCGQATEKFPTSPAASAATRNDDVTHKRSFLNIKELPVTNYLNASHDERVPAMFHRRGQEFRSVNSLEVDYALI